MKNKKRIITIIVVISLVVSITTIFVAKTLFSTERSLISYDQVITYIKNGDVKQINATQDSKKITVILNDGKEEKCNIPNLSSFSSFISKELKQGANIEYNILEKPVKLSEITSLLHSILMIFMVFFLLFTLKNTFSGDNNDFSPVTSNVKFLDVAGIDEEKEQFIEILNFLKYPKDYVSMGAKIPKGILLNGEPGNGKTLLAKAIAGEAKIPFIQVTGSTFEEKFVGVGASKVRKLFTKAKKLAPCIIFIDEIDSIAQERYSDNNDSKNEQTLNQLLSEMDGFDSRDNIIVIAATNNIDVLDPAILRPGRFDRQINIPKPNVLARKKILEVHSKNKKLSDEISLESIAQKTIGFSGAQLENVLNEAAIYATNQKAPYITQDAIDEAILKVILGLKKNNAYLSKEDLKLSAVHEAGHALASAIYRPEVENLGISIIPRGNSAGYNLFDEADTNYKTKIDFIKQIKVLYGGRIAEEIIFNDISTGASNDLEQISKIAYLMVTKFAMYDNFLVKIHSETDYNNELNKKSLKTVKAICKSAYDETKKDLSSHKDLLIKLSDKLLEKEYLSKEEVSEFIKNNLR